MNNSGESRYYYDYKMILDNCTVKNPFFSVFIPTYKRPNLLIESIKSVLESVDFEDYEIVISDNNPEVENQSIKNVRELNSNHIRYFQNSENIGLVRNGIMAAYHCKGRWLVLLDDDDLLSPYYFKVMYEAIQRKSLKGMIGCRDVRFSDDYFFKKEGIECSGHYVSAKQVYAGDRGAGAGTAMSRADWLEIALGETVAEYDEYLMGDMVFEYLLAKEKGLYRIDAVLSATRIGPNAATNGLGEEFLLGIHRFWETYKYDSLTNYLSKGIFIKQLTENMLDGIIRTVNVEMDYIAIMKKVFGEQYKPSGKIMKKVCWLFDKVFTKILCIRLSVDEYNVRA